MQYQVCHVKVWQQREDAHMADTSLSPDLLAFDFASCHIKSMVGHFELLVGAQVLENICEQVVFLHTWDCERDVVSLAPGTS